MIGAEACQKGGSMRSKPMAARPGGEEKAAAGASLPRPPLAPGSLALVVAADKRPATPMTPGLY